MNEVVAGRSIVKQLFQIPVIVAALGYFVDIYDLLLFGIVRLPSLKDLGLDENQISATGTSILNWQMTGLTLGGILWGVLGDKKDRLSVLFGSILPRNLRAIGTSMVAGIGLVGAVVAYFTVEWFNWRVAYFIGGGMGIALLLLRIGVFESNVFTQIKSQKHLQRGNFFSLFTNRTRLFKYLKCVGIGLPTWFVIGILATFSNEFGNALNINGPVNPGLSIMWCYIGLSIGDLSSGFISQAFRSRKKAVFYMMLFTIVFTLIYLFAGIQNSSWFYAVTLFLGIGIGYWAMFVTIGAEQFGTNLRATAATTIPNMVRGTVVLMTGMFGYFKTSFSTIYSGAIVGAIVFSWEFILFFPAQKHMEGFGFS